MNPAEFSWTEDQSVHVINPTSEEFTWKVHGKEYALPAGATAQMPGFIAWLYVYNQGVKAAQADDKFNRWNDEEFRKEYYERFISGVDDLVQVRPEEPVSPVKVDAPKVEEPKPEEAKSGKSPVKA